MDELLRVPTVYFQIGPIVIDETIVSLWAIMAIMVVFSIILTRNFKWLPSGRQNLIEMVVDGIASFVGFIMGEHRKGFTAYIGTIIIFILLANLAGLWSFGLLRPPTADVRTTLALGLLTFFGINYHAIKAKGLFKYLRGFLDPFPLFLPMNIIGELAKPVSLGFRLFGNIFGGLVIVGLVYQGLPFLVPIPLHLYFDLFSGLLQTLVFSILTMVFFSLAID